MLKIIVATDAGDYPDVFNLVIAVEVEDEGADVRHVIKNACREYCLTDEGKEQYDINCRNFNWGDLVDYLPAEFCEKHGFKILDSQAVEKLNVDFNEQLVCEDEIFPVE